MYLEEERYSVEWLQYFVGWLCDSSRVCWRITAVWQSSQHHASGPQCPKHPVPYGKCLDQQQSHLLCFSGGCCVWTEKLKVRRDHRYSLWVRILMTQKRNRNWLHRLSSSFSKEAKVAPGFRIALIFSLWEGGQTCTFIFHSISIVSFWHEPKYGKKLAFLEGNYLKLQPFWLHQISEL
jgi:hypothetical protein